MSDELLRIEAGTLCDLAEEAADILIEYEGPGQRWTDLAENIRKISFRLRDILNEHPEPHDDIDSKAQFHREEAKKKSIGLLIR